MNLQNAIIDKIQTMKDGSLKIVLVTRELTPHQMAELFLKLNEEVLTIDLPDDPSESKSKAQRLRGVLFKDWEQNKQEKFDTSELYYAHEMERIINCIKDRLA